MHFTNPADTLNKWIQSAKPKDILAHFLMRHAKSFERFLGLHIIPLHYYSATPTIRELDAKVFDKIYDCPGLDWNLPRQMEYCRDRFPKYHQEYAALLDTSCDSFILYAMVREKKPKTMVEIGAGGSTKISLAALEKNREEGHDYHLYSVDPYPQALLRNIRNERHMLLENKVQDLAIEPLADADLLFIDSSHVCKIGGDVNFEMLELVPRLKIGALVQWHDIMIPNNYGEDWVKAGLFFNESYLLHAFMLFNSAFKVALASRYMRIKHAEQTSELFAPLASNDSELLNVSFWVERVA